MNDLVPQGESLSKQGTYQTKWLKTLLFQWDDVKELSL